MEGDCLDVAFVRILIRRIFADRISTNREVGLQLSDRYMLAKPFTPHRRVDALIDWNSQFHLVRNRSLHPHSASLSRLVLKYLCRRVSECLVKAEPSGRFEVHLRAYHGWRNGYEPTPRRRAAIDAQSVDPNDPNDQGLLGYSSRREVIFRSFAFGDKLLFALDKRLHAELDCHLPGTLQRVRDDYEEKMVDTALASDLVYLAFADTNSWLMVVGQDRDLVPALYVAEAAINGTERRVFFLARDSISLLKLDGLQYP